MSSTSIEEHCLKGKTETTEQYLPLPTQAPAPPNDAESATVIYEPTANAANDLNKNKQNKAINTFNTGTTGVTVVPESSNPLVAMKGDATRISESGTPPAPVPQATTLDEKRLAQELATAVMKDERRKAVDDMKKRSVLTARSYDEFRHLVACAEDDQKPVTSREMETLGKSLTHEGPVLNKAVGSQQHIAPVFTSRRLGSRRLRKHIVAARPETDATMGMLNAPATTQEFERVWRRACTSPEKRFEYLMTFTAETVSKVFKIEISQLGDIVRTLEVAMGAPTDLQRKALELLYNISKVPRFELSLNLLTGKEGSVLDSFLREAQVDEARKELVAKLYGIRIGENSVPSTNVSR